MKTLEIAKAKGSLSRYAREASREPLVITRRGRPVAVVVPIRGVDLEDLALTTNSDFIALIERSRASFKATGGISLEEMRRRYGRPKRAPKAAARRARKTPLTRSRKR